MENRKINLEKGYVLVYDFGKVKVHNYNTADYIDDQVILLEKNKKLVIIESPAFFDNSVELEKYIKSLDVKIDGILLSYHMAGGTFLKDVKKYATHNADDYGHSGGGKSLIDNFTKAFGNSFDNNIHSVTDYISDGKITLADIDMNIISTNEGYDIEIPEINSIYTHMLGSDSHSIIAGAEHINAVKTKISYIKTVLDIASKCSDANKMIEKVKEKFPSYSGLNYLEMTANYFFTS